MAATASLAATGHTRPVTHLAFSPLQPVLQPEDSPYVVISSCKDGKPMLRNWTGDWLGTFIGHKGAVWSSKISPDTSRAVTGSADFTAKVWDTYDGIELHSFEHRHIVRSVDISPTKSHIVTGDQESKIRIFDLQRPDTAPTFLINPGSAKGTAHDKTVKSVIWIGAGTAGSGGDIIVSGGEDSVIRWWDLRTNQPIKQLAVSAPITSLELSAPLSTLVFTYGKSVSCHTLSPTDDIPPHTVELNYRPSSASLHPTLGDRFVTGSLDDPWVRVYGLEDGEERELNKGHHGSAHCVMYSPDGEMYASGSEDGTIRLWQTYPGKSYGLWKGSANP